MVRKRLEKKKQKLQTNNNKTKLIQKLSLLSKKGI
jgi:hypothetical protein